MTTLLAYFSNTQIYIDTLISLLQGFGGLTIFFGVFLFGEVVIFFSILFTQQSSLELWVVFMASVLGLLTADTLWFLIGRYFSPKLVPNFIRHKLLYPVSIFLDTYTKDKIFLSLLFFKFFIGTRLAFVLYLSRQPEVSFIKFIIYDLVGTVIYITFLSGIGVFLGGFINDVFSVYKTIISIFSSIFLLIILSFVFKKLYYKSR
jgi:membrane-associated protein